MTKVTEAAPYAVFGGVGAYLADRFVAVASTSPGLTNGAKFSQALQDFPNVLSTHPLAFSVSSYPLLACGGVLAMAGLMYAARDTRVYRRGEEYGNARFGTRREMRSFANRKDFSKNIILGQGCYMNMEEGNNPLTARNNNVIVIGGSGAWKTTSYIMTNLAQMNASFVVTDPKGMTVKRVGKMLEEQGGYKVKVVDFDSLKNTDHFNPFKYVHDEITLLQVIKVLIDASNGQHGKKGEPFWDKSEEMLLSSLFAYLYYRYRGDGSIPGDGKLPSLADIGKLIRLLDSKDNIPSVLEIMFENFAKKFGRENFAVTQFENLKAYQGQTRASVVAIATARFAMFDLPQVKNFIQDDTLEMDKWIEEKYAVFLKIPDMGNSFDFLTTMIFLLAFRRLEERVDHEFEGEALQPLRFLMDEFANLGVIPNIEEALSVLRSRKISIELIIQSIHQLEKHYKDVYKTFFGNCDSVVYLAGSTEPTTQKWLSEDAGKQTIYTKERQQRQVIYRPMARDLITYSEVAKLQRTKALVRISSNDYFKIPKYNYKKHPNAKYFSNSPRDGNWYYFKHYDSLLEAWRDNVKREQEQNNKQIVPEYMTLQKIESEKLYA